MKKMMISPSVFAANLATLPEEIQTLETAGADLLHVDVMDGHFVERMAFGADHIKMLKQMTKLPLDVHLMIEEPERHVESIVAAGADIVTIHAESTTRLYSTLQLIQKCGAKAGVVLNPATSESVLDYVLDEISMVLQMTVNPGEGGQHFLPAMLPKIRRIREKIGDRPIDIEVDGSISNENIKACQEAGANVFVSGGYLFKDIAAHTAALRQALAV